MDYNPFKLKSNKMDYDSFKIHYNWLLRIIIYTFCCKTIWKTCNISALLTDYSQSKPTRIKPPPPPLCPHPHLPKLPPPLSYVYLYAHPHVCLSLSPTPPPS